MTTRPQPRSEWVNSSRVPTPTQWVGHQLECKRVAMLDELDTLEGQVRSARATLESNDVEGALLSSHPFTPERFTQLIQEFNVLQLLVRLQRAGHIQVDAPAETRQPAAAAR